MARKGQIDARNPLAEFGMAIQAGRIAKGWTLKELGYAALGRNETQGYVSQIENGKRRITPLTAGKFARALDLPMSVVEPLRAASPEADEVTEQDIAAEALLDQSTREAPKSQVSEALLIALAYEYAPGSTGDLQSAYAGLRQALAEAAELKARAALPQNTGDAVQAVLRRVADLNERGLLDAGQSELDDALARLQAEQATLLDQAGTQARLRNDPATAARHMVDRLRIDAPDTLFDALRALMQERYYIGVRQGIGFDLALSIDIARHSHRIGATDWQRNAALNDLAIALQTQGIRTGGEAGTALLAEAVAAYRQALDVRTRADHPVQWARTTQNLAGALQRQGTRTGGEAGTALLAEAVAAFRQALEVRTRANHPVQWATTMQNLAVALQNQGTRTGGEAGTALLAEAVAAYRQALEVTTRADHPVDWAMTMQNLAGALQIQGIRTGGEAGTALLAEAVAAYWQALEVRTRADHPVDWAGTMQNLAVALQHQGTRTGGEAGTALLAEAVAAYRPALEVRTRADHPVDWAMTQGNMAICEMNWSQHPACDDPLPHLRAALEHVDASLTVYDPVHMSYYHDKATELRADILAALAAAG